MHDFDLKNTDDVTILFCKKCGKSYEMKASSTWQEIPFLGNHGPQPCDETSEPVEPTIVVTNATKPYQFTCSCEKPFAPYGNKY